MVEPKHVNTVFVPKHVNTVFVPKHVNTVFVHDAVERLCTMHVQSYGCPGTALHMCTILVQSKSCPLTALHVYEACAEVKLSRYSPACALYMCMLVQNGRCPGTALHVCTMLVSANLLLVFIDQKTQTVKNKQKNRF